MLSKHFWWLLIIQEQFPSSWLGLQGYVWPELPLTPMLQGLYPLRASLPSPYSPHIFSLTLTSLRTKGISDSLYWPTPQKKHYPTSTRHFQAPHCDLFSQYHLSLLANVDEYACTCTHMYKYAYAHICIHTYMHTWIHAMINAVNAHAVRNKKIESYPQGTHRPLPMDSKYFPV